MTEMTSVGNDFANAIEIDHLTKDQIDELLKILNK